MQSTNSNDGTMSLTVTFDIDSDANLDQVNVQNRVAQAQPNLPTDVSQFGLSFRKSTGTPMMLVSLYSPKNVYDSLFLANYANININDALYRVRGVGEVRVFGASDYAMRIWIKPDRLAQLGLTVPDLLRAIQQQNNVNPAGKLGAEPGPPGREMTYTVRAQGRLLTAEEFGQIVVRSTPNASVVRLADVARIELGALNYQQRARINGQPGATIAVFQSPGLERARRRRGRQADHGRAPGSLPGRPRLPHHARHHPAGHPGHPRDPGDDPDRDAAGHAGGVRLPAELARHADPDDRGPGVAHRHLRGLPAARVLDQHAVACSASCWPSAWWWTTPSSSWRRCSTTSRRACRRATPPCAR